MLYIDLFLYLCSSSLNLKLGNLLTGVIVTETGTVMSGQGTGTGTETETGTGTERGT